MRRLFIDPEMAGFGVDLTPFPPLEFLTGFIPLPLLREGGQGDRLPNNINELGESFYLDGRINGS